MDSTSKEMENEITSMCKDEFEIEESSNDVRSGEDDQELLCTPDINPSTAENLVDFSNSEPYDNIKSRLLGFGLAPTPKRRHNVLSLENKLELIKRLENGETVASLSKLYNIGRATIFDIKNKKDSILSFASRLNSDDELKTRKTVRKNPGKSRAKSNNEECVSNPSTSTDAKMALCMYGTPPKRKHIVLSIESKLEIIQRLEKGESGASLAPLYNVGRATISDIKNKKDSILMFASKLKSEDGLKKRKTMRNANDISLENAVYMWYIQKLTQGEVVTGPLLCEKALELNAKLGGPSDFKASTGWLKNFRSRHGIKQMQNEKESFAVDPSEVDNFLYSYIDLLQQEGYSRDDIYAADEAEIDWQTMPENSVVFKRLCKERSEPPDRITVLVCANTSWTHALPLLMIGKKKKKTYFGKVSCLPVKYKWQKNGWMDSEIFMEWYANEFIPQVKKERERSGKYGKVLLLLDTAPFHPHPDMLNVVDENFSVMFLPANVTIFAHPMNKNVIQKLKRMLKKQILRRLLLETDDEESMVNFSKKFTLKECSYMLADAWHILSEWHKQDNWKKLWGISDEVENADPHTEEKDLKEFAELFKALPGFSKCTLENAREWLKIDSWDPGNQILNEDQIVTSVMINSQTEDSENSDLEEQTEDEGECNPTHSEAFNAFDLAMEWCEQQKECSSDQLILLKRLKDLAAKKIWISCDMSKTKK